MTVQGPKDSLSQEDRDRFVFRAQVILDNLKTSTSAAEVHEVDNMRHTAALLIESLLKNYILGPAAEIVLKSLEKKHLDFFKKKFGPKV